MCNGRLPYDITCKRIQNRLEDNDMHECSIRKWRFHPYWSLLHLKKPGYKNVKSCLTTVNDEIQQLIYKKLPIKNESDYMFNRKEITPELINSIAEHANFDDLVVLTALSRESPHDDIP